VLLSRIFFVFLILNVHLHFSEILEQGIGVWLCLLSALFNNQILFFLVARAAAFAPNIRVILCINVFKNLKFVAEIALFFIILKYI